MLFLFRSFVRSLIRTRSFIAEFFFYWIFHFSFHVPQIWLNSAGASCLTVSDQARQYSARNVNACWCIVLALVLIRFCFMCMRMQWTIFRLAVSKLRANTFLPNLIIGSGRFVSRYFGFVPPHHFDVHFIFNWLLSIRQNEPQSPSPSLSSSSSTTHFTCVHVKFAYITDTVQYGFSLCEVCIVLSS